MSVGSVSPVSQASSLAPATRFQWLQTLKAVDVRIVALAVGLVCVLALAIRWWRSSAQLPAALPQQRSSSSSAISSAAPSATSAPSSAVSASDQQIVAAVTAIEAELKTFVGQNRDNVTCKIAPTTAMTGHFGKKFDGKIVSIAKSGDFNTAGEKAFSEKWSDLHEKLPIWLKQFGGQKITFLVLADDSGHNDSAKAKVVECDFSSVPAPQPVTSSSAVVASSISLSTATVSSTSQPMIATTSMAAAVSAPTLTAALQPDPIAAAVIRAQSAALGLFPNAQSSPKSCTLFAVDSDRIIDQTSSAEWDLFFTEILPKWLNEKSQKNDQFSFKMDGISQTSESRRNKITSNEVINVTFR